MDKHGNAYQIPAVTDPPSEHNFWRLVNEIREQGIFDPHAEKIAWAGIEIVTGLTYEDFSYGTYLWPSEPFHEAFTDPDLTAEKIITLLTLQELRR